MFDDAADYCRQMLSMPLPPAPPPLRLLPFEAAASDVLMPLPLTPPPLPPRRQQHAFTS
jgi:hypothetical protein